MLHSYSVDIPRQRIHIIFGIAAVGVGFAAETVVSQFIGTTSIGIPLLATATGLFYLFDRHLWKHPPCSWLHPIPHIGGTWEGEIESSHSPTGEQTDVTPINPDGSQLRITQRWSTIEVNYRNPGSSSSRSISARLEAKSTEPRVTYVYENEPEGDGIETTQESHSGTAILTLNESDGTRTLRGRYYNDHQGGQSYGRMKFDKTND